MPTMLYPKPVLRLLELQTPKHLPHSLAYAAYFGIIGLHLSYITPVLLQLGFEKREAGWLQGAMAGFSIVMPGLVGRLAHRMGGAHTTFKICTHIMLAATIAAASMVLGLKALPLWLLAAAMLVYGMAKSPCVALLDNLTLEHVAGQTHRYAKIRLWGSIGFVVASSLAGLLGAQAPKPFFRAWMALAAVLAASAVWGLKAASKAPKSPTSFKQDPSHKPQPSLKTPSQTQPKRRYGVWFAALGLHWMAFGPYNYGLTLLLGQAGIPAHWAGSFWSIGVVAEVLVLMNLGRINPRFSSESMLAWAMGASLLRWLVVGLWPNPVVIGISQALHGPGFALFYTAAIGHIHSTTPAAKRPARQGLLGSCLGLAMVLGMGSSGWMHEFWPLNQMVLAMIPLQIAALLLLGLHIHWQCPARWAQA